MDKIRGVLLLPAILAIGVVEVISHAVFKRPPEVERYLKGHPKPWTDGYDDQATH